MRIRGTDEPLRWIGGLLHSQTAASLRLAKEQLTQISLLDDLTRRVQVRIARDALGFLDKPRNVRRKLYKSNEDLAEQILGHAEAMVPGGLLTSSQTALLRKWRWASLQIYALRDEEIARYLRLTKEQRKELTKRYAQISANEAARMPFMFSTASDAPARVSALLEADKQLIWDVLDPFQQARWASALSENLVPSGPPSPAKGATAAQKHRLEEVEDAAERVKKKPPSEIFRSLSDPAILARLTVSEEQVRMINDLDQITRAGRSFLILAQARRRRPVTLREPGGRSRLPASSA